MLAVATAGLAAASSLPMVAVLRSIQGLVAASFSTVALAYVGEALPAAVAGHGDRRDVDLGLLSAGILGQVYAQAVADALGWRWVFGLAAPAFVIAAIAMATILLEPPRRGDPGLGARFKELGAMAIRPELTLINAAALPVLLSFVAMYAALGPLLQPSSGSAKPASCSSVSPGFRPCCWPRLPAGS